MTPEVLFYKYEEDFGIKDYSFTKGNAQRSKRTALSTKRIRDQYSLEFAGSSDSYFKMPTLNFG